MFTGSIYQRSGSRWVAAVHLNDRKIVKHGKTKADARHRLKDLLKQQHAGTRTSPTISRSASG
jgi:hypothetical protein